MKQMCKFNPSKWNFLIKTFTFFLFFSLSHLSYAELVDFSKDDANGSQGADCTPATPSDATIDALCMRVNEGVIGTAGPQTFSTGINGGSLITPVTVDLSVIEDNGIGGGVNARHTYIIVKSDGSPTDHVINRTETRKFQDEDSVPTTVDTTSEIIYTFGSPTIFTIASPVVQISAIDTADTVIITPVGVASGGPDFWTVTNVTKGTFTEDANHVLTLNPNVFGQYMTFTINPTSAISGLTLRHLKKGANTSVNSFQHILDVPIASFTLTKVDGTPTTAAGFNNAVTDAGDTIPYTFVVTNSLGSGLTGLALVDPDVGAFTNTIPTGLLAANFDLIAGASATFTANHTITQVEMDAGTFSNSAVVSDGGGADADSDDSDISNSTACPGGQTGIECDPTITPLTRISAWTLTKALTAMPTVAGITTASYSFSVENTGNVTITPTGFTDAQCITAPTVASPDSQSINGDGVIDVGEIWVYSCDHTVTQSEIDAGTVSNTATISGTAPGNNPVDATDTLNSPVAQTAIWTLTKSLTSGIISAANDTASYQFSVTNTGSPTSPSVTITPVTFTDAQCLVVPTATSPDSGDTILNGNIDVGETWIYTCDHTVTQTEVDAGTVNNTATIAGTAPGSNPANATDTLNTGIIANPSWILNKTSSSTPSVAGNSANYNFSLANTGNVSISAVTLTDAQCNTAPTLNSGDDGDNILEVTETWVYLCSHTVTQAEVDAGTVNNSASASGTPAGGVLPNATDILNIAITPSPAWTLNKTSSSTPSVAGNSANYSFSLDNTGNVSISAVTLTDAQCNVAPTLNSGDDGDNILEVTETWIYLCSHTVTQAEVDAGTVNNSVSASGTPAGGVLPNATDTLNIAITPSPVWTLNKTSSSTPSVAGNSANYSFSLANTGNISISAVTLTDTQCNAVPTLNSGDDGDNILEVTETWVYLCSHTVTQAEVNAGTVNNSASASGTPAGGVLPNATDTLNIAITPSPAWTLDKTSSSTPTAAGQAVSYGFSLDNMGNVSINTITLTDAQCDAAPTLNIGDTNNNLVLEVTETWTYSCSHTVTLAEVTAGTVNNSASASGTPVGGVLANATDTLSIAIPQANLSVNKVLTDTAPYLTGDTVTYTLTIANAGLDSATGVKVTDSPNNLTIASVAVSGASGVTDCTPITIVQVGGCSVGETVIGTLPAGDNIILTMTATIDAGGVFSNAATVTSDIFDPDTLDNTDNEAANGDTAGFVADISITKALQDDSPYQTGDTVTYTLTITNAGPDTATTINIVDTPTNLSLQSVAISGASGVTDCTTINLLTGCSVGETTVGTVPSGDSVVLTVTANITSGGSFSNLATITIAENDPNLLNNSANDGSTATSVIVANTDDFSASPVNGLVGGTVGDVTTNDTLDGVAVVDTDITITVTNVGGLTGVTINTTGGIIIPANTAAATYNVTYQICQNSNPTNCDTAVATVQVNPAVIDAIVDDFSATPINGLVGGSAGDVTTNDTLNGVAFVDTDVAITITNIGGLTGVTIDATGNVIVPANTVAGSYDVTYQICENLNPTNCDSAIATVQVNPAVIDAIADDFSATPVNGLVGGTSGDVTTNDTLNGAAFVDTDVAITVTNIGGLTGVTIDATGNVIVPANTASASYDVTYQICENLNPTNCDTAIATIQVDPAVIDAIVDDFSATPVNGLVGGTAGDVTANDTLNGAAFVDTNVTITVTNTGGLTGVTIDATGNVIIPANTPAASYDVTYQICENLNPTNCDTAVATVQVNPAVIAAVADDFSATPINGLVGGTAGDVTTNDSLNGAAFADTDVTITITNIGGLTGVTIDATGNVTVPANTTAGSYNVTYQICENANPTNCDTAIATVQVNPPVIDAVVDDFTATVVNGVVGATVGDVTTNDTLNGVAVVDTNIAITVTDIGGLTGVTINATGGVVIPANTTPNTYTVTYQICENINPTNCDTATVALEVLGLPINAVNDDFTATPISGFAGGVTGDVTLNDTLNNVTVVNSDITISVIDDDGLTGISFNAGGVFGAINIPGLIVPKTYNITYQICEKAIPTNCDTAIATILVLSSTDLSIIKLLQDDSPYLTGNTVTYTLTVENKGLIEAIGVKIIDAPNNLTIRSVAILGATGVTDCTINTITQVGGCSVGKTVIGRLSAGDSVSLTVTATINVGGGFTNSATVSNDVPDSDNSNNTDNEAANGDTAGSIADISIIKFLQDGSPYKTGDTVTYTLTVANAGPDTATNINIVDAPTKLTLQTISVLGATGVTDCTAATLLTGCSVGESTVGTLPSSNSVVLIITALINSGGSFTNVATITIAETDPDTTNNSANDGSTAISIIVANADDLTTSPVNGLIGGTVGDVTSNDTLDSTAVVDADITITVTTNGGLTGVTINATGEIIIPANTSAATYNITYQICENAIPTNCDTAVATVVVEAATIDAIDDDFTGAPVNGLIGGTAGDATSNDTLNGIAVTDANITMTITANGGLTGVTINTSGEIIVPASTPAITYIVTYQICENLNPTNCDTANATVVVNPPVIDAVVDDFSGAPVNGLTGGTAGDVTTNDTLNGVSVTDSDINISITNNGGLTNATIDATGNISVPAGTTAGTYSITYQICEKADATNCDTAIATVVVNPPVIDAVVDDFSGSPVNGLTGGTAGDVTVNDTLNGVAVTDSDIAISITVEGGLTGVTVDATGNIIVPAGTTAGTYDITYQICENANPTNCDTATATVVVNPPAIDAITDNFSGSAVSSINGGIAGDVTLNDTLNGVAVNDNNITITLTANGGLTGATIDAAGNITVPAGSAAGSYNITYQICEKANPTNCDTAVATVVVSASSIDAVVDDFSSSPVDGIAGGIAGDVTLNDTLNGTAVNDNDITLTITANGGLTGATISATGNISIPAGTTAGTYNLTYQICEKANPTNCDTAVATIVVSGSSIDALVDDFSGTPVNGITGGVVGDVTLNDTLNGTAVNDVNINISITTNGGLTGVTIDATGNISVPVNTPSGTYNVTYQICEKANPTSCDTAVVTIVVASSPVATDDVGTGTIGLPATVNVTTNDTTGSTVDPSTIILSATTVAGEGVWSVSTTGIVTFTPETGFTSNPTPISYTIKDTNNVTSNSATITFNYAPAAVTGVVFIDVNGDGIQNNGETGVQNILINLIPVSDPTQVINLQTQADGTFSQGVVPGTYTVQLTTPAGIIIKEQVVTVAAGDTAFVPEAIDPAGIVYNETTGAAVAGAIVRITDGNGTALPTACLDTNLGGGQTQTTGVTGQYSFFLIPGADVTFCPATNFEYRIAITPPTGLESSTRPQGQNAFAGKPQLPQTGILTADACNIDADNTTVTCEVSTQTIAPIVAPFPIYFLRFVIGANDPAIFNNHIPLTPIVVIPVIPATPVPTLSSWTRICLALLMGLWVMVTWRRRRMV